MVYDRMTQIEKVKGLLSLWKTRGVKPTLEGWNFYQIGETLSAQSGDRGQEVEPYQVTVVRIIGGELRPQVSSFTKHPKGCCVFCGERLEKWVYCPSCGAS